MKNSSLEKATEVIIKALVETEQLDNIDRAELMLNITHFLDTNDYRENVKVLAKRRNNKWKKNY